MFSKTYTVYIRPEDTHPLESMKLVKDGFVVWPMVFGIFWALYHRAWGLVLFWTGLFVVLAALVQLDVITLLERMLVETAFSLYISLGAGDIVAKSFEKQGYALAEIAIARNKEEARQRVFERYLPVEPVELAGASA